MILASGIMGGASAAASWDLFGPTLSGDIVGQRVICNPQASPSGVYIRDDIIYVTDSQSNEKVAKWKRGSPMYRLA